MYGAECHVCGLPHACFPFLTRRHFIFLLRDRATRSGWCSARTTAGGWDTLALATAARRLPRPWAGSQAIMWRRWRQRRRRRGVVATCFRSRVHPILHCSSSKGPRPYSTYNNESFIRPRPSRGHCECDRARTREERGVPSRLNKKSNVSSTWLQRAAAQDSQHRGCGGTPVGRGQRVP